MLGAGSGGESSEQVTQQEKVSLCKRASLASSSNKMAHSLRLPFFTLIPKKGPGRFRVQEGLRSNKTWLFLGRKERMCFCGGTCVEAWAVSFLVTCLKLAIIISCHLGLL